MNGKLLVWYKEYKSGKWQCYNRRTVGYTYSRTSDWLSNAESSMKGDRNNPLWRKSDEAARRMVWC